MCSIFRVYEVLDMRILESNSLDSNFHNKILVYNKICLVQSFYLVWWEHTIIRKLGKIPSST